MRWLLKPAGRVAAPILAAMLAACTTLGDDSRTPPVQEMSDARQALQAARSVGGEHHVPETFERAEQLIREAVANLNRGDFRSARAAALSAREQAMAARRAALYIQRLE